MEPWKQAEVAYEDAIADTYDFHYYRLPIPIAHLHVFCKLIRQYADREQRILDLGAGTGVVSRELLADGYTRVVSADLSLAMLREAKKKVPGISAVVCDGESLPFKNDVFQTIVCSSVLHHLPDPGSILKEVRRSLAVYGVVVAQEPNESPFLTQPGSEPLSGRVINLMHYLYRVERYVPVSEPPVHAYHRAFTRQELVGLFSKHLYILEMSSQFGFSYVFAKLRSPVLSRLIVWLDRGLQRKEGSVFHLVCSKTDAGHRALVKDYFRCLEQLRKTPEGLVSGFFILCLLPMIVLGRVYELYWRARAKVWGIG